MPTAVILDHPDLFDGKSRFELLRVMEYEGEYRVIGQGKKENIESAKELNPDWTWKNAIGLDRDQLNELLREVRKTLLLNEIEKAA